MVENIRLSIEHIKPDVGWDDTQVGPEATGCDPIDDPHARSFQSNIYKTSYTPSPEEWPEWTGAVTEVADEFGFTVNGDVPDQDVQNRFTYSDPEGDVIRVSSSDTSGFVFDAYSACVPSNAAMS